MHLRPVAGFAEGRLGGVSLRQFPVAVDRHYDPSDIRGVAAIQRTGGQDGRLQTVICQAMDAND